MATFVLVHGAWHGGWCWRRVERLLRARGHEVFAPTLSGVGERAHLSSPAIDLSTHIADIVGELRVKELSDVVLVGHSYGGMVITGVAESELARIASIVYLDAHVPGNGQSVFDLAGYVREDDPLLPTPAADFLVNEADRAWVDRQCTPQSAACFKQKLFHTGAFQRVAKKTYIRPLDYASARFDKACAPLREDPSWRVIDVRGSGHDVMLDKPEELARLLEEAA